MLFLGQETEILPGRSPASLAMRCHKVAEVESLPSKGMPSNISRIFCTWHLVTVLLIPLWQTKMTRFIVLVSCADSRMLNGHTCCSDILEDEDHLPRVISGILSSIMPTWYIYMTEAIFNVTSCHEDDVRVLMAMVLLQLVSTAIWHPLTATTIYLKSINKW